MGNEKRTPWHTGTVDVLEKVEPDGTLRVIDGYRVYNARGELVADCGAYDGSDSRAAFIVQTCNAHDALVAVCETMRTELAHLGKYDPHLEDNLVLPAVLDQAEAAIALAKETADG